MHKSSRKSAKVFHEKDATLIAEKVCVLKQLVGGWWEEKVDRTPCNGALRSILVKLSYSLKGEPYTGNPYVRFDEGTEVVRPPPTLLDGA